jgi:hypothetical protein
MKTALATDGIWTREDLEVLLWRMQSCVMDTQGASVLTMQRVEPDTSLWTPELHGRILRDMGKWVNDGEPTSALGTGDGILPAIRKVQEKVKAGTVESIEIYNLAIVFSRSILLDQVFAISLIHWPLTVAGRKVEEIDDLGIDARWMARHFGGFESERQPSL